MEKEKPNQELLAFCAKLMEDYKLDVLQFNHDKIQIQIHKSKHQSEPQPKQEEVKNTIDNLLFE